MLTVRRTIATALVASAATALSAAPAAADTTPPRVGKVQLLGDRNVPRSPSCRVMSSDLNPGSPYVRLDLSEPATVTLRLQPLLGRVRFLATSGGSSSEVSLPAGPQLLQFGAGSARADDDATQVDAVVGGAGYAGLQVTARDAAGNRSRVSYSNVIAFGFGGGMGQQATWPCDTPRTQQAKLQRQLERFLASLFG